MSAKTLKSEVVAAAVATSGCGPEGVEVVEGAEVEQAFGRLEHLYAQLPAMEEKGAALARARSAATVDGLAKAAAYRAAELVRADALVTEAEARVSAAEAEGEQAAGEARLALMAAGTQRGLRVGPAQNAEQALARALEASPFDTVEEARAAMLPAESPLWPLKWRPTRPPTPQRWPYVSSWKTAKNRKVSSSRPLPSR